MDFDGLPICYGPKETSSSRAHTVFIHCDKDVTGCSELSYGM